ncbi:dienelactone hydrolase family protein [Bowmanella denitrificans]|uniref:dienelactone hydrolase family protein n=1 Tax=Bowmanella denitrificans TaxID=366582 RepID=UPI000C9B429C|nr:dienelactone hydrolase family protein [Bowmanella denitrificans]
MSKPRHPALTDEMFQLYDQYAHGRMDRRAFLTALSKLAVGGITALTLYQYLSPDYAAAEQVSFNDPQLKATYVSYPSPAGHGEGKGYLVLPQPLAEPAPVVLVIHENRGLNPYIKDVARRFAKAGFIALAPDGLAPVGGYPGNDDDGRAMQRSLDGDKLREDLFAAARHAKRLEQGNGKLGVVGFCFGGAITNLMAAQLPELVNAAVPFYGSAAPLEQVGNIQAPLLIQYAENDERVNSQWPAYQQALEAHKKTYQVHFYPGTQHGFHNDSTPRYAKEAAELAWQRTVAFFNQHLQG